MLCFEQLAPGKWSLLYCNHLPPHSIILPFSYSFLQKRLITERGFMIPLSNHVSHCSHPLHYQTRNSPYPDHVKRLEWDLIMMESWRRWIAPWGVNTAWRHILDVVVSWQTGCVGWIHSHVSNFIRRRLWSGKMPNLLLISNFSEGHHDCNHSDTE